MARPVEVALVGHTNAGKTSLLRTLTRRRDFGEVSDRPGTTRHVEWLDLVVDGVPVVRFFDTPGLEDSTALLALLHGLDRALTPPDRIRAFLRRPEAADRFEQEAKVLRAMLEVDAAFQVIDTRDPVLPKHRAELEILSWCARPLMPVLNFVRDAASREAAWTAALSDYGLHAVARFDAVAPFAGSEQRLYRSLATLLPSREAALTEVIESLELERLDRRAASHTTVARLLVAAAAMRQTVSRAELDEPARRAAIVQAFHAGILARARGAVAELLEIHAFGADEARLELLPWLDGRWADDLFNPETLKAAGRALRTGALVGASVGVVADLALAGLSLGAGAAIGATVGGVASQGLGAVGRKLANTLRGRVELSVEDEVLAVLADQLLTLVLALEQRGHAATAAVVLRGTLGEASPARQASLRALLGLLNRARAHPAWAGPAVAAVEADAARREGDRPPGQGRAPALSTGSRVRRDALVQDVVAALRAVVATRV